MKWFQLYPKTRAALQLGLAGLAASVLSAWNGTTTWHETIGVGLGALFAVVGAWFASNDPKDAQ